MNKPLPSDVVAGLAVRRGLSRPDQVAECLAAQASSKDLNDLGDLLVQRGFLSRVQHEMLVSQAGAGGPDAPVGFASEADLLRKAVRQNLIKQADVAAILASYAAGPANKKMSELLLELGLLDFAKTQALGIRPEPAKKIPELKKGTSRGMRAIPARPARPPQKMTLLAVGGGGALLLIVLIIVLASGGSPAPTVAVTIVEPRSVMLDGEMRLSAQTQGGEPPFLFVWNFSDPDTSAGFSHETRDPATAFRPPQAGTYRVSVTVTDRKGRRASSDRTDLSVDVAAPLSGEIVVKPAGGLAPLSVQVQAKIRGGLKPVRIEWKTAAGASASGETARITLAAPGKHSITMTAEDKAGQKLTRVREIAVDDPSVSVAILKLPVLRSSGTGFIVENNGERFIVTNEHVASGVGPIYAVLFEPQADRLNERRIQCRVVAVHPEMDLVVLKPQTEPDRPPLALASVLPTMNERIRVIGFSGGFSLLAREGSAGQYDTQSKLFNFSASVNPGDSGGPVLKSDSAEVLGVTVRRYERTGGGRIVQGHAEAIPASFVRELLGSMPASAAPPSSIAAPARAELQSMKEKILEIARGLKEVEAKLDKLPENDGPTRGKLFNQMESIYVAARLRMEEFVKSARTLLSREGPGSPWGAVLWQARATAEILCRPDIDERSWREMLDLLYGICSTATAPAGKCNMCQGKGELQCRWCQGMGTCPACRKQIDPDCANCSGTGRCLWCNQSLKYPCLLCEGKGSWPP